MNIRRQLAFVVVGCFQVFCLAFMNASCFETFPEIGCIGTPLPLAHAHNDYHSDDPLEGALRLGFTSIEVDVIERFGAAYVAHENDEIRPFYTLRRTYLPQLEAYATAHGEIFRDGTPLLLLVDLKNSPAALYSEILQGLREREGIFSRFEGGVKRDGLVTVVISGDSCERVARMDPSGLLFCDGTLRDLDVARNSRMLMVSGDWQTLFSWNGVGAIPPAEEQQLASLVQMAQGHGYLLRFWNLPEKDVAARHALWHTLQRAGVSKIGTDYPEDLAAFLGRTEAGGCP